MNIVDLESLRWSVHVYMHVHFCIYTYCVHDCALSLYMYNIPLPATRDDVHSEHHDIQASYTVTLRELSERVSSVKDLQFLHGYNNPTLFILYEPTPTWAG